MSREVSFPTEKQETRKKVKKVSLLPFLLFLAKVKKVSVLLFLAKVKEVKKVSLMPEHHSRAYGREACRHHGVHRCACRPYPPPCPVMPAIPASLPSHAGINVNVLHAGINVNVLHAGIPPSY